jgi:hypothetical protein
VGDGVTSGKSRVEHSIVESIALDEREAWVPKGLLQEPALSRGKIIEADDLDALIEKGID